MVKPITDVSLDIDTDRDLNEIWPEVLAEYQRITGIPVGKGGDFNQLSRAVEADIDSSKSKNKAKAKKVLNNCAKCLQQFGGMVASAASMVFGPAGQCYNALSFVISVARGIQELFDGFITLLEHCTAFLDRVNLHLKSQLPGTETCLPPHLRNPVGGNSAHSF